MNKLYPETIELNESNDLEILNKELLEQAIKRISKY